MSFEAEIALSYDTIYCFYDGELPRKEFEDS